MLDFFLNKLILQEDFENNFRKYFQNFEKNLKVIWKQLSKKFLEKISKKIVTIFRITFLEKIKFLQKIL